MKERRPRRSGQQAHQPQSRAASVTRASKKLSWLLRHGATETGVDMDEAGWVPIDQVLKALRIGRDTLDMVVAENNKQRLQLRDGRVRAVQGHSTDGTPVTAQALEETWQLVTSDDVLWHGTTVESARLIAAGGVKPMGRTHVHLAAGLNSTVGKRSNVALMLEVDPNRVRAAGQEIWRSPNGVILVRFVPASSVVGVQGRTRRGREAEAEIAALFAANG